MSLSTTNKAPIVNDSETTIKSLLSGAIEFHVHPGPDGKTLRKMDMFEVVRAARMVGMRAVVLKDKSCGTGAIAQLVNKYAGGCLAIGAITLDVSIGGINPAAVEIEAALGSKVVWMPTYSARNDPSKKKTDKDRRQNDLVILRDNGELLPEVIEIIEIIKQHEMVLATGHLSREEIFTLIGMAAEKGVKKMVITHPLSENVGTRLSVKDQIQLAQMGAYIEHTWVASLPRHANIPISDFVEAIRAVGVKKCIMATDFGQMHNPAPIEGFRMMLKALLAEGFSEEELAYMVRKNQVELLGLAL